VLHSNPVGTKTRQDVAEESWRGLGSQSGFLYD
jgi:hypothetical protein